MPAPRQVGPTCTARLSLPRCAALPASQPRLGELQWHRPQKTPLLFWCRRPTTQVRPPAGSQGQDAPSLVPDVAQHQCCCTGSRGNVGRRAAAAARRRRLWKGSGIYSAGRPQGDRAPCWMRRWALQPGLASARCQREGPVRRLAVHVKQDCWRIVMSLTGFRGDAMR